MNIERDAIANELMTGCPDDARADHEVLALRIRRGDPAPAILDSPECDRWPMTYSWIKDRMVKP